MNGKKARLIRRSVYGDVMSPRHRTQTRHRLSLKRKGITLKADQLRRVYQEAKRAYLRAKRRTP